MGHRANFAIVDRGNQYCFGHHWVAGSLLAVLAWGPRIATEFVRSCHACRPEDWYPEPWCEGGAIIDADRREMLFFGDENLEIASPPLRDRYLFWIGRMWPGWSVAWAHGGIFDLAQGIGLDPETMLWSEYLSDATIVTSPLPDVDPLGDAVVTVREDGRVRGGHAIASVQSLWGNQSDTLVFLQKTGFEPVAYPSDRLWTSSPFGGIHVDIDNNELFWWHTEVGPDIARRAARAWPGWKTTWWRDQYEQHVAGAEGMFVPPRIDRAELDKVVLEFLSHASESEYAPEHTSERKTLLEKVFGTPGE